MALHGTVTEVMSITEGWPLQAEENSTHKGHKVGMCLERLRNIKEVTITGKEKGRGQNENRDQMM